MLKREEYLKFIGDSLSILEFTVANRAALRLFDLNVVAESFFVHVLNIVYNLKLRNLNDAGSMPGLDLGDDSTKVAFQVTSDSSHAKLQKTIDKVVRWELYKRFSDIRILIIGKKQRGYRKPFNTQGFFSFNPSSDVVDLRDLIKEVQHLTTTQLEQLHETIGRELHRPDTEPAVLKQADQTSTYQEDLERASYDLLTWPRILPGGAQLVRPELEVMLQKLDELESSATVLLGPPGSGKSALLAQLAQEATLRGCPVLAIKADILDPEVSDEAGLQRQLMLSDAPSTLLSRLAASGRVLLLIDQVDALAGFVDLRTGRLNALLYLIRRLARRKNVHVVVSARTFEFNHDVRLRSIDADTLNLELPPWSEILPVLAARNLKPEGWPPDAHQTLRTPQHLATFLRLVDSGASEPFQSYQAMLERVWIDRVLHAPNGKQLAKLATDIANAMAQEESLWLARSRYDDRANDLQELERLEILKPSADALSFGFTHQTLYDYVLARSFVRGKGRLSAYVAGREASLFIRPKLWVALNYLRSVENAVYESEVVTIWNSDQLRPHLKLLLVEFMGQQKDPTATERQLMKPVLESGADRTFALRAIAGSPGWFNAVAGSAIAPAMKESEQTAWLVTGVLQQAWAFAPERVVSLIRQHWIHDSRFDPHLWTVLREVQTWSEIIAELAVMVLQRTAIAGLYVEPVIADLGVDQPEIALRLVRARLDQDLAAAVQVANERARKPPPAESDDLSAQVAWRLEDSAAKPLESLLDQRQEWHVLPTLAEMAPGPFMDAMWPWFRELLQTLVRVQTREEREIYPLMWTLDFHLKARTTTSTFPRRPS
jgi:hypothetical protein